MLVVFSLEFFCTCLLDCVEILSQSQFCRISFTKSWNFRRARMAKEVAKLKEEAEMLKRTNFRWVFCRWIFYLNKLTLLFGANLTYISLFWMVSIVVITPNQCLLVREIQGFMHLKTCLLLHLAPWFLWHHNCQKQKSASGVLLGGHAGTKFGLLLMQKMWWIICSI